MFPIPNPVGVLGGVADLSGGWMWDKVVQGVYVWVANGVLLLLEWVWGILDAASSPRLAEAWFVSGLLRPISSIGLAVVIALMLASAVQAGFAGRPELVADAFKEGPKAIVASALTVTVLDVLLQGADVLAGAVWQAGRADTVRVLDGVVTAVTSSGSLGSTFLGPLVLLFGMLGLLVTAVVLFMRSALLYLVAGFAPIVWSASVSPVLRGAGRKLVQVALALVLAKPAITLTLVVGSKLAGNSFTGAGGSDASAGLGTLLTGFACFAIGGLSPWVVYRLLPAVEGASLTSGIVGGWGRSAMTGAQTAMLAKSLGASRAASPATRAVPAGSGVADTPATGRPAAGRPAAGGPGPAGGVARSGPARMSNRPPTRPPLRTATRADDEQAERAS